jgi:caffeoyl-CoA O-methyltransferase
MAAAGGPQRGCYRAGADRSGEERAVVIPEDVERYAQAHTSPEPPHLARLAEETRAATEVPQMMVGPLEGRFLQFLVAMTGARRVLEIGTFTGYSALSMAEALPPDGRIVTCELSEVHAAIAARHIGESPHAGRIEIRLGPALDTIAALEGPFDLVFIDADKGNYRNYYEAVLPKLAPSGVIAVDNVLWGGAVVRGDDDSPDTRAIAEFNDFVASDDRVECVMVTIRDGVTLIRLRR